VQRGTVEELARGPVGRFVVGDTFAHFCAAPTLWGVVLWGRPDHAQAMQLGRSLVLELQAPAVAHASIFDASRLAVADPGAFRAAERYVTRFAALLGERLTRLALVRPDGMSGAVVAGAFEVLPRPYPARVFADARAAFAWLAEAGAPADWPADGPALLAALHAEASAAPTLLVPLRALLEARLVGLAVADAARELGLSARTLQRKLGELGTTFQDEQSAARVRVAKRLLVETDAPITNIALDVGCASLQHLGALFRKREGQSPTAFRQRRRAR
jgi:AraC-like DNA-binding protein